MSPVHRVNLVWRLHGVELQARERQISRDTHGPPTKGYRSVPWQPSSQKPMRQEQCLAANVCQSSCSLRCSCPRRPRNTPSPHVKVSWPRACCPGQQVNSTVPTSGSGRGTPPKTPPPGNLAGGRRPEDGPGAGLEVRWLCQEPFRAQSVSSSSPIPKRVRLRFGCCVEYPMNGHDQDDRPSTRPLGMTASRVHMPTRVCLRWR
jgi:hypothetical protein